MESYSLTYNSRDVLTILKLNDYGNLNEIVSTYSANFAPAYFDEDTECLRIIQDRQSDSTISLDEFLTTLRTDGILAH